MIAKALLRKRLGIAIDKQLTPSDFTWFFSAFCEKWNRPDLRTVKELSYDDVCAFSRYCGYDLNFPIPMPILE